MFHASGKFWSALLRPFPVTHCQAIYRFRLTDVFSYAFVRPFLDTDPPFIIKHDTQRCLARES